MEARAFPSVVDPVGHASAMSNAGVRVMERKNGGNGAHATYKKCARSAPARTSSFGPAATEEDEEEGANMDTMMEHAEVWKVKKLRMSSEVTTSMCVMMCICVCFYGGGVRR